MPPHPGYLRRALLAPQDFLNHPKPKTRKAKAFWPIPGAAARQGAGDPAATLVLPATRDAGCFAETTKHIELDKLKAR